MIWFLVLALVAAVGVGVFWWYRRSRESVLVSFVVLLREPMNLDPAVLASAAGRAWNLDLGDGEAEGVDGFIAGAGITSAIVQKDRTCIVNSFPTPYVKDVEKAAEEIVDLRIRGLFLEHQAWFSCDAMGVTRSTPAAAIREWYQRLGLLVAEFLDENCLLIVVPEPSRAFPINEETEASLRAEDPVAALQATLTLPFIQIADDDPHMKQAVEEARSRFGEFVSAFENRAGESFSVKAPVSRGENTEFIWISVTAIEGDRIYGALGNDPVSLDGLRLGSKVSIAVEDLNDWCYEDPQGQLVGVFTLAAMKKSLKRKPRGR